MNFIEFDFQVESVQQSETLIALLSNIGFEGFEETTHALKAFVTEHAFDEKIFTESIDGVYKISYSKNVIENQNWNELWENSFDPVIIDNFVGIRASFHAPLKNVAEEIIITPKMSFGTGHHATTYAMIKLMKKLDFKNKKVLDFGTGTGVLAILAEKLGAAQVLGIDNDEWSIDNAQENCTANGCKATTIQQQDVLPVGEKYDVVLANINLNVIIANISHLVNVCKAGAVVLFSGLLDSDEQHICSVLVKNQFLVKEVYRKNNWIGIETQCNMSIL